MLGWTCIPALSEVSDPAVLLGFPGPLNVPPELERSDIDTPRGAAGQIVDSWLSVLAARDPALCAHSRRVGWLARGLGRALGLPVDCLVALDWAGRLHDLGKLGIPDAILFKPAALTPEEFERVKLHPRLSHELLRHQPLLDRTLPAVLHHHENHDGSGYPDGLCGDEIPLSARIMRLADSFDAMTSSRVYRARLSFDEALAELRAGAGTATEPELTSLFCDLLARMRRGDPTALPRHSQPVLISSC